MNQVTPQVPVCERPPLVRSARESMIAEEHLTGASDADGSRLLHLALSFQRELGADQRCVHRACCIEEAHVAELTGLLREGPGGDQLRACRRRCGSSPAASGHTRGPQLTGCTLLPLSADFRLTDFH